MAPGSILPTGCGPGAGVAGVAGGGRGMAGQGSALSPSDCKTPANIKAGGTQKSIKLNYFKVGLIETLAKNSSNV